MTEPFSLGQVEVASTPLERFEEFLQSRGKRITSQKRLLVEHELLDELRERPETRRLVSRPTVYRVLGELLEAGLLRRMDLRGRSVYEHDYGYPQHDHLHCQRCDKLVEFHSDELDRICQRVAQEHRFRHRAHRLIVSGICPECAGQPRRKRPVDLI
jgi:Fur family transcriptional regulator, ferric uptake regulator